jgi:DNA polymerase III subunit alpha
MKFVEKAGLVKFDFLGLKTLTILSKAEKLIKEKNNKFNLNDISLDDKNTFEMLSTGSTIGVFQLESAGMKDVLIGLKPDRFEDIIAVVSLYRPGPMENIPTYINRKHGKEKIIYMHPDLEEILDETYGIFIYQEQVLRAAQILADFSLGSADILRRAMGKKDKNEMFEQKQSFLSGAKNKNINESKATEIFDQISAFAGYGFNKSHAAAYALIAYQTAWIKCNYPQEFFASMMTVEHNNNEKLSVFVEDLKKINIPILPPCINNSSHSFIIQKVSNSPLSIRYSLSALKNIGYEAVQKIIDIRNNKGNFKNIDDFLNKVPYRLLTKKSLESLIMSGAFDCLDVNRNKLFNSIDLILNYSNSIEKEKISNQQNLFNVTDNNQLSIKLPETYNWGEEEKLNNEFLSLGYYLSSHPLNLFLNVLNEIQIIKSSEILENPFNYVRKNIKLCGLVFKLQKRQSPRGKWATFQLNDLGGNCEVTLYSDALLKHEHNLDQKKPILIDVELKTDSNQGTRIIAKRIMLLEEYILQNKFDLILTLNDQSSIIAINLITQNLNFGKSNIFIKFIVDNKIIKINICENVKLSTSLLDELSKVKNINNIKYSLN